MQHIQMKWMLSNSAKGNAVYIHVKSEDGTEKTFKVNILKLPENKRYNGSRLNRK